MSWFPFYYLSLQMPTGSVSGPGAHNSGGHVSSASLCQNDIQMVTSNRTRRHNQTAFCWSSSTVGRPVSDTSVDAVLPSNGIIHFSKQFTYDSSISTDIMNFDIMNFVGKGFPWSCLISLSFESSPQTAAVENVLLLLTVRMTSDPKETCSTHEPAAWLRVPSAWSCGCKTSS